MTIGWLDDLFGAAGAPSDAQYITVALDASLTGERQLALSGLSGSDGGAGGSYTISLQASGVAAGSYAGAVITVDSYGRVTAVAPSGVATTNGFIDRADSVLSFVDATRTYTITPAAGSFVYWASGEKYTATVAKSVVFADTEGLHFTYFDGATLTDTTTWSDDLIFSHALVGITYWDATNAKQIGLGDERHGAIMDPMTHAYLHNVFGARLESGGGLGDIVADASGDLDSHAEFSCEASVMWDEDIKFDHAARASTDNVAVYYRSGADASDIWRADATATFPALTTGTGRAAYNQLSGGTWSQTEVANNDFVLAHVFVTNDSTHRFAVVQGQADYTSLSAAQAGALTEISALVVSGLPTKEFVFVATIIMQTSNGHGNAVQTRIVSTEDGGDYVDLRDLTITRSGIGGAVVSHNALAGVQGGSANEYYHVTEEQHATRMRWTEIPVTQYTAAPASSSTITISDSDLMDDLAVGDPIKWLTADAMGISGDEHSQLAAVTLTGLVEAHTDRQGIVWVYVLEDAAPDFWIEVYSHPDLDSAHKIAHTAIFDHTASAARTLIEDNDSGLTGSITNAAGACVDASQIAIVAELPAIVESITTTTITIRGLALPAAGTMLKLWRGSPELVGRIAFRIDGAFASASSTLLDDDTQQPYEHRSALAHIVEFAAAANSVASTFAKVNLINAGNPVSSSNSSDGVEIATAKTWARTVVDLNTDATLLRHGTDEIELKSTAGNAGNTDLDVVVTTVRM